MSFPSSFADIVAQVARETAKVAKVTVDGLTVSVTYKSGLGRATQSATLFFDETGRFVSWRALYKSANVPKILGENIEKALKK